MRSNIAIRVKFASSEGTEFIHGLAGDLIQWLIDNALANDLEAAGDWVEFEALRSLATRPSRKLLVLQ